MYIRKTELILLTGFLAWVVNIYSCYAHHNMYSCFGPEKVRSRLPINLNIIGRLTSNESTRDHCIRRTTSCQESSKMYTSYTELHFLVNGVIVTLVYAYFRFSFIFITSY